MAAAQSLSDARARMLSLYRAWLGPSPCVARPAPPPGAHRPVPRRARAPSPPAAPPPRPASRSPSRSSSASSDVDVERVEPAEAPRRAGGAVLDVAACDGPVRFSRVPNAAWRAGSPGREWPCRARKPRAALHYYPCKTCGCKFPSYYFVHKHRKRCHADEEDNEQPAAPEPSTSGA